MLKFQKTTFGKTDIDFSAISAGTFYLGDAVGNKTSQALAGSMDLHYDNSMYSQKAMFRIVPTERFIVGGTHEVITLTFATVPAADATCNIVLRGKTYSVDVTSGETVANIATAVKGLTFADFTATSSAGVVTFTAKKSGAGTKTNSCTFSASVSTTGTFAVTTAGTKDGGDDDIKIALYSSSDNVTFTHHMDFYTRANELKVGAYPPVETMLPSTLKRYVYLAVTTTKGYDAGKILFHIIPTRF